MRVKALIAFKSKLSTSCNRFASVFRFKLKRPVSIRPLLARPRHLKLRKPPPTSRKHLATLLSFLCFPKRKKMNSLHDTSSFSEAVSDAKLLQSPITPAKKLFPSPITPAYVRTRKANHRESLRNIDIVEDACRSFENYLIHMIIEEGKVEDLMDIEELLHCWRNLKSPVFVDLVSRFYGELCRDLFSSDDDNNEADIVNHNSEE